MATWYINPDHTYDGDGTTPGKAASAGAVGAHNTWATTGELTWVDGDTYLQARGTLASVSVPIAPTVNNVTLGAYGPGPRPAIQQTGSGQTCMIEMEDVTGYVVRDLELHWDGVNELVTSAMRNVQAVETRIDALIDNVHVSGVDTNNGATKGITAKNVTHLTIQNCEVENVGTDALYLDTCGYINIYNCYLHDFDQDSISGGDGIQLNLDGHHYHVAGNTIIHPDTAGASKGCIVGSGISYNCWYNIFEYNYIYGGTFGISVGGQHNIIRSNYIEGTGVKTNKNIATGYNSQIYNNILVGNNDTENIQFTNNCNVAGTTLEIYNNVIYMTGGTNSRAFDVGGGQSTDQAPTVIFRNNIFYHDASISVNGRYYVTTGALQVRANNNCYYGITGTPRWFIGGTSYNNLGQVQALGLEVDSTEGVDPLLNQDYTLAPDSPCLESGVRPLSDYDHNGRRLINSRYNKGAFWSDWHKDSTEPPVLLASGAKR